MYLWHRGSMGDQYGCNTEAARGGGRLVVTQGRNLGSAERERGARGRVGPGARAGRSREAAGRAGPGGAGKGREGPGEAERDGPDRAVSVRRGEPRARGQRHGRDDCECGRGRGDEAADSCGAGTRHRDGGPAPGPAVSGPGSAPSASPVVFPAGVGAVSPRCRSAAGGGLGREEKGLLAPVKGSRARPGGLVPGREVGRVERGSCGLTGSCPCPLACPCPRVTPERLSVPFRTAPLSAPGTPIFTFVNTDTSLPVPGGSPSPVPPRSAPAAVQELGFLGSSWSPVALPPPSFPGLSHDQCSAQ